MQQPVHLQCLHTARQRPPGHCPLVHATMGCAFSSTSPNPAVNDTQKAMQYGNRDKMLAGSAHCRTVQWSEIALSEIKAADEAQAIASKQDTACVLDTITW